MKKISSHKLAHLLHTCDVFDVDTNSYADVTPCEIDQGYYHLFSRDDIDQSFESTINVNDSYRFLDQDIDTVIVDGVDGTRLKLKLSISATKHCDDIEAINKMTSSLSMQRTSYDIETGTDAAILDDGKRALARVIETFSID